jgi:hypothetical protein
MALSPRPQRKKRATIHFDDKYIYSKPPKQQRAKTAKSPARKRVQKLVVQPADTAVPS